MKYPQGSFITKDGERRKILGEAGEMRFVSSPERIADILPDWDKEYDFSGTVFVLERDGWVEEASKWEPKFGEMYYFIGEDAKVYSAHWDCVDRDDGIRDFMGVFPSFEAAEARLKEIRAKLGI